MKRLIALILVAMLLVPTVALASDITGAKWYSIITASNTNAEADDVFTIFTLGTQDLIDANFLSANLTDCAMHDTAGIDTAFMPSVNTTYPWCFYVNHIGEDAFKNYLLYTGGNTDMGGKIRYFPGAGGMVTTDNDTLELSANFTIEQKGWVDTDNGTDKNLVFKKGAFRLYVSPTVSENITAAILGWTANFTETRRPDGHDTCVIPSQAGVACNDHYLNVDEAGGGDDGATTVFCTATGATTYTDIYTLEDTSINATAQITQVQTTIKGEISGNGQYRVGLKLDADTTWGAFFTDAAWASHNEVLARPGGGSWQPSDLDDLKIMVYVVANGAGGNDATVTQCYITTTFQNPVETVTVTATGVESGEHTVTEAMDSPFFGLGIDTSGDFLPIRDNLAFNAPLWQEELDSSPFDTIDTNEYTCTVVDAIWTSDGYEFDGTDDLISANALATSANFSDNHTVMVWAKLSEWTSTHCLGFAGRTTAVRYETIQFNGATNRLVATNSDGVNSNTVTSLGTYNNDSDWHFLVMVVNDSGHITNFYIDNIDQGSDTSNNVDLSVLDEVFYIGQLPYTSANINEWQGTIGEVLVYFRALTLEKIRQNYNATKGKYGIDSDISIYSTLSGAPDNDNDWAFIENYSMPYMEHHKIWIDGVLQQHIEYEYDDTVFRDLSGQSHPAYPTFRTASSDADVSAVMASWEPIEEAQAPAWVLEEERDFWDTENITATGEFTATPTPTAAPGIDIIEAISAASGTPTQLPFNVIAGFVILAVSLTATWFLAKQGSRNIWLKIILITICMAVCVAVRVFDFWMVVFFLIMAIAVALFSRQRSAI